MDASNLWFFGMHLLTSAFCLMSPIFHLLYSVSRPLAHVFGLPLSIFRLILSSCVCQRPFHLSSSIFSLSYSIGHHSSLVSRHPSLVYCLQSPIFFFHLSYPISHPLSSASVHLSSSSPRLLSSVFYLLTFIWCY